MEYCVFCILRLRTEDSPEALAFGVLFRFPRANGNIAFEVNGIIPAPRNTFDDIGKALVIFEPQGHSLTRFKPVTKTNNPTHIECVQGIFILYPDPGFGAVNIRVELNPGFVHQSKLWAGFGINPAGEFVFDQGRNQEIVDVLGIGTAFLLTRNLQ